MNRSTCNSNLPAYEHWRCQKKRFHLGRHRFNNYTSSRVPRIWRVRNLIHWYEGRKRAKKMYEADGKNLPSVFSIRRVLYPVRFDPLPIPLRIPREFKSKMEAVVNGEVRR